METSDQENESDDNKEKNHQNKQKQEQDKKNPLEGLGLEGFTIPDWLKHLLSGAGSLGAAYILFIKPMHEKMEIMQSQIAKQKDKIKDLQRDHERILLQLNNELNKKSKHRDEELFTTKSGNSEQGKSPYNNSNHVHL
ncbi:MAG: hypothetical protein H0W73_07735 [Bacteroidetes bacterium]|nr:hypothetical protein [Bacteroidota bacterium]